MKVLLFAFTLCAAVTTRAELAPADAFASIKKLRGEWRGPAIQKGMPPSHSIYKVTAGGSAVQESIFPGTKMEMLSVYHMDRGNLVMTHYCALGNQPRMKFNPKKSSPNELVFDFDGGTNVSRQGAHMHSLKLALSGKGPQKIVASGTSWEGGKEKGSCSSTMTRVN